MRIQEGGLRTVFSSLAALGLMACAGSGDGTIVAVSDDAGLPPLDSAVQLAPPATTSTPEAGLTSPPQADAPATPPPSSGTDSGATKVDASPPPGDYASIPLTDPDGFQYDAKAQVGGQSFSLSLDTGSTTLAVAGSSCSSCSSAGVSPLYTPETGAVNEHDTGQSQYADGSGWSGEIYDDTVAVGDGTPSVSLRFVSMTSQDMFFQDDSTQGILGLGPIYNALPDTGAYFAAVTSAGEPPILGFELCATSGTMWIGGYDAASASGAVQYTPMPQVNQNNPFYSINIDKLSVGTTALPYSASDFQQPVVDTGTSLFYLPTPVFTALLDAINGSSAVDSLFGGSKFTDSSSQQSCVNTTASAATVNSMLPSLTYSLPSASGGADFTITAAPLDSYLYDAGGGQFCLAAGDGGDQMGAIFGDTFMQAFVTVIDTQNGRIGFAQDSGCAAKGDAPMIYHHHGKPHRPRRHGR